MTGFREVSRAGKMAFRQSPRSVAYLREGEFLKWRLSAIPEDVYLRTSALDRIALDLASVGKRRQEGEEIGGLLLGSRGGARAQPFVRILSVDTYCSTALHQVLGRVKKRMAKSKLEICAIPARSWPLWPQSCPFLLRGA